MKVIVQFHHLALLAVYTCVVCFLFQSEKYFSWWYSDIQIIGTPPPKLPKSFRVLRYFEDGFAFTRISPGDFWKLPTFPGKARVTFSNRYEDLRRTVRTELYEYWKRFKRFSATEGIMLSLIRPSFITDLKKILRRRFIQSVALLEKRRENDGFDSQRQRLSQNLNVEVQKHFKTLQNPEDCNRAKIFYCANSYHKARGNPVPICGWGCLVIQLVRCFKSALADNRMLLADMSFFRLHEHFAPLSQKCRFKEMPDDAPLWAQNIATERILKFEPITRTIGRLPREIGSITGPTIPSTLFKSLELASPDPEQWFYGQILAYLTRPSPRFQKEFDEMIKNRPKAAIQVRRSDKLEREAKAFGSNAYMEFVEEYFDVQVAKGHTDIKRQVYVATDDPYVIDEIKRDYSQYEVIANLSAAILTSNPGVRYSSEEQANLFKDFFNLVYADFLVCTLSSNLCRLVYKLRLVAKPMVTDLHDLISLDEDYFEDYGKYYEVRHHSYSKRQGEMQFEKGDSIRGERLYLKNIHTVQPHTGKNLKRRSEGHFYRAAMKKQLPVSDQFPLFNLPNKPYIS